MFDNIIIIPYRNRIHHWEHYLQKTVPLIEELLPNSKIVVIEQNEGKQFNRGAILNVAFAEFKSKTKYYITNDVDINPTNKCIEEYFVTGVPEKKVKGIYTSRYNTLGGIIKISDVIIHQINGFPNDIWGWGTEDKALQNRADFYNIEKITNMINNREYPEYLLRFNDVDDREITNLQKNTHYHFCHFSNLSAEQKFESICKSGIKNLNYKILERIQIHPIVEWIKVEI